MYKKQEWKDEIPDLSKPILDSTGKQKVDPQTGRPLWELVQEGTRITSARLNHMEDGIQAAHDSINNISQSLTPEAIGAVKKADLDTFQKNSVSIKTNTSKDFNTYRDPGLFFVGSLSEYTNAPSSDGGFSWGILRVETLGTTAYVAQSYTCIINNVTFTRSKAEDSTGRGWEPWRATSKLDSDGVLRLTNWLDIRGEAGLLHLYGTTHGYITFNQGGVRRGYVGLGDPNAPNNMTLSADNGNLWLNAGNGGVFVQGRNVLYEIDQLKQSGVNNKQALVDALNAMGIAASINEDWGTLIAKVRQAKTVKTVYLNQEFSHTPDGVLKVPIHDMPAGTTIVNFATDKDYDSQISAWSYNGNVYRWAVWDAYGNTCMLSEGLNGWLCYLYSFTIDIKNNNVRSMYYDNNNNYRLNYKNEAAGLNPDKGITFGLYLWGTGQAIKGATKGMLHYA